MSSKYRVSLVGQIVQALAQDKNLRSQLEKDTTILQKLLELVMDPSTRDESLLASLSALGAFVEHEKAFSLIIYEHSGALESIAS